MSISSVRFSNLSFEGKLYHDNQINDGEETSHSKPWKVNPSSNWLPTFKNYRNWLIKTKRSKSIQNTPTSRYHDNNSTRHKKEVENKFNMIKNLPPPQMVTLKRQYSVPVETLKVLRILGSGAFGTVFLCKNNISGRLCALKSMNKEKIRSLGQARNIRTEKYSLECSHPFKVKIYRAFETKNHVHFELEYCPGGDLFYLLDKFGRLSEEVTKFYAACIVLVVQHLHDRDIIYRDLKPENILIGADGFLRLTDFGLCRRDLKDGASTRTFCGSIDYLAPEVLHGNGYGKAADLWSLGCLIYEILTGYPPFYTPNSRPALFQKIKEGNVIYPAYLSMEACDLISGFLTLDPEKRLGNGKRKFEDVLKHPFFNEIDWNMLLKKELKAPYVPDIHHSLDTQHFPDEFTSLPIDKDIADSVGKINFPSNNNSVDSGEIIDFEEYEDYY